MELVLGITGELQPDPYVDCPEEGCVYTLEHGVLMRHQRDAELVIREKALPVDPELDALEHERPRLHRIARMLAESAATARLASPFVVFVPREGDPATKGIRKSSGIVGAPLPGAERVVVDYEGAIYEQTKMARLADRVFYAHGRLVERYPTVARITVPRASLIEVGTFDPAGGTIAPVDEGAEAALASWLGSEQLDPAELARSGSAPGWPPARASR